MDALKVVGQSQALEPAGQVARPERPRTEQVTAPPSPAGEETAAPSLDRDQIKELAGQLERRTGLKVEMVEDEKSGVALLRIMSPDGERVLRQFPSEAALKLADRLRNTASSEGLLASLLVQ